MTSDRVACLGECMVELRELPDGRLERSWGGDTLNTALYLARLGVRVDYVSALGDDGWSEEMVQAWREEGIGTALVFRVPGTLPGLYVIQTDAGGERRFQYWRDSAAARRLMRLLPDGALRPFGTIYLSGISLSILEPADRAALLDLLARARADGARIVFDTNFRPRGWPDRQAAQRAYRTVFEIAGIVLASQEDLRLLFGADGEAALFRHADPAAEIVLKLDEPVCRVLSGGSEWTVAAEPVSRVRDTTAAGDSFAAAYLAARLRGRSPPDAAASGHRLAGAVVGHPGAIIPRAAMPPLPLETPA